MLQSIDKKFIIIVLLILLLPMGKSFGFDSKKFNPDAGIIALMYHRFEENKYPSTNIKMDVFKEHLKEIQSQGIEFINLKKFQNAFKQKIDKNYLLLTIDDAYESFYKNAWPILKNNKIPFILFVSTREVNKSGYMTWSQIKDIEKNDWVTIGNHSHSHDYLIDWNVDKIEADLKESIKIFKNELGHSPKIFSYPFGEYSSQLKNIVKNLEFKFAFGQHSGVIDPTKDPLELPRFPINEKYGEIKRFKSIIKTLPFPFEIITPQDRYLLDKNNPPEVKIKFYDNLINVENINCYSNEGNKWRKSNIKFLNKNELAIILAEKFESERGRINCSLLVNNGRWRWLGIQYVIAKYK